MRKTVSVLTVASLAGLASAQAIVGWSGGSEFGSYYGSIVAGDVVGWTFQMSSDMYITDVGLFIDSQDATITTTHDVGLWDTASQTLLQAWSVGPDGMNNVINGFGYVDVADYALSAGDTYTVGFLVFGDDGDGYISGASNVQTDPSLTWLNSNYPVDADFGFVFPVNTSTSGGRWGANFLLSDIPAPSTLGLLALGLVARRRR